MAEKDLNTSQISAAETAQNDSERTLVAPHFDAEEAARRARPVVPLAEVERKNSWPKWLIVLAVVAGIGGGVLGSVIATNYVRQRAAHVGPVSATNPNAAAEQPVAQTNPAQSVAEIKPVGASPVAQQSQVNSAQPDANAADARKEVREESASATNAASDETEAALRSALNEWIAATNARDLNRQMSFYTQKVNAFYLSRNASREDVRAEKARVFERANNIDIRAADPEIKLSPDGRTATMRFRKRYTIEGGGQDRRGEVLQELRWQRVGGRWKIVSERDLRVVQ